MPKIALKKYISIIILLLIPSISFGQTENVCTTCGSSPTDFKLINDLTTEILSTIKTIGTANPYLGKPVPPSRFESGKFTPPEQGNMAKSLRRAREDVSSILSLTRIYSPLSIGNGMISTADSLVILMRNQVFLRDWKKLNQTEELINQKKYELSVGGGRTDPIKGTTLKQIEKIINTYQEKGILDSSSQIKEGAEYNSILVILGAINKSLKHLVATNSTSRIKEQFAQDHIALKINNDAVDNILTDYSCARGQKCNSSREQLKKDLKELGNSIKNGSSNAIKQIKDANKKLSTATATQPTKTNDTPNPETSLLQSIYGLKAKEIQEGGFLGYKNRRSQIQKQTQEIKDVTSNYKNPINTDNFSQPDIQTKTDNLNIKTDTTDIRKTIMENALTNALTSIETEAAEANKSAQFTMNNDVSAYFSDLSYKLTFLTKQIIGSKDQENTLIKNLGDLCTKQCSNITNKKCFY